MTNDNYRKNTYSLFAVCCFTNNSLTRSLQWLQLVTFHSPTVQTSCCSCSSSIPSWLTKHMCFAAWITYFYVIMLPVGYDFKVAMEGRPSPLVLDILSNLSLKEEPNIYFRAQAWAKCLLLLFPSATTSFMLEPDKLHAWAQAWKIFEPHPSLIFYLCSQCHKTIFRSFSVLL